MKTTCVCVDASSLTHPCICSSITSRDDPVPVRGSDRMCSCVKVVFPDPHLGVPTHPLQDGENVLFPDPHLGVPTHPLQDGENFLFPDPHLRVPTHYKTTRMSCFPTLTFAYRPTHHKAARGAGSVPVSMFQCLFTGTAFRCRTMVT